MGSTLRGGGGGVTPFPEVTCTLRCGHPAPHPGPWAGGPHLCVAPCMATCVAYFLLLRPLAHTLGVTFLGGEFGLSLLLFYPTQSIPLRAIPMEGTGKCFLLLPLCAQIQALLVTLHLE